MHNEVETRFHIDAERLVRALTLSQDLLTQHFDGLSRTPVKAQIEPGTIASNFSTMPHHGEDMARLLATIKEKFLPGITHWQHPNFFAFYPATTSIPAIIGELLIAAFGSIGIQWETNPVATELECVVMDWLLDLLDAPHDSPFRHTSKMGGGLIQNTAGEAIAVLMVAARIEAHRRRAECEGITLTAEELYYQDSSKLVAYMSDQTHFSGLKAVRVAGMRVHKLKARLLANGNYGISASDVLAAIDSDRAQGLHPAVVQLNFGSTNTSGCDDIASFDGFAERLGVWVHIDAAYAGPALILPAWRTLSHAIQRIATSFNFNGSKWLLCGFDSAFLFIRDRTLLKRVFAADGDYLAPVHQAEESFNPEFRDWAIPLGRRFRALRVWMVLSYFGRDGLIDFLCHTIELADQARALIASSKTLREVAHTEFGLVCFRLNSDDEAKNAFFIERVKEQSCNGRNFLIYPSLLEGQSFLRLAVGSVHTMLGHVTDMMSLCDRIARETLVSTATSR